jgi:hypothetical protein
VMQPANWAQGFARHACTKGGILLCLSEICRCGKTKGQGHDYKATQGVLNITDVLKLNVCTEAYSFLVFGGESHF